MLTIREPGTFFLGMSLKATLIVWGSAAMEVLLFVLAWIREYSWAKAH